MKKQLIKLYKYLNIDTENWNSLQMLFGEHYIGLALLAIMVIIYVL